MLGEIDGNEGNFDDGLWVQQVINAVEISHHERRWVTLPLDAAPPSDGHVRSGQPGSATESLA